MRKIEVCAAEECRRLGKKLVIVEGREILLIYTEGEYFAVDNFCPHAKTRLMSGRVEDLTITCSNHGTCFDLRSGAIRTDKIDEDLLELLDVEHLPFGPLQTFQLLVENDQIVLLI